MTTESGCDFWTKALMVTKALASWFDSMSVQMQIYEMKCVSVKIIKKRTRAN